MDKREKIEQAVKDVITGGGDTAATIALVTLITNSVMAAIKSEQEQPPPRRNWLEVTEETPEDDACNDVS